MRILIALLFCFNAGFGQGLDSLAMLIKKMQKGENDSIRFAANDKFQEEFKSLLKEQGSFTRNFDTLSNISVVQSEDKKFRIYTWVVPRYDGSQYFYFGFLQYKIESKGLDSTSVIPLLDSTSVVKKPESEKLLPEKWYGAVYYGVQKKEKSRVAYYSLFGWKGKNEKETQKVIEVLYFKKNVPHFGFPLFKTGSVFKNRMVFTFDSHSTMALNYDEKFGGIVFDHIATNKRSEFLTSGPDGTYDTFRWKKGKWQLYKDVDVRTKWEPKKELPVPPEGEPEPK